MNAQPHQLIDHRDNNGLNNIRLNLRIATKSTNEANSQKRGNKSPYKGITWIPSRNKWQAQITVNYTHKSLGYFDNPWDAAQAYNIAALAAWGEFAVLNTYRVVK